MSVRDLKVAVGPTDDALAVAGVSFDVERGKVLGIVGESGSGKTLTALAALRLLPEPNARVVDGSIKLDGVDLLQLSWSELRLLRSSRLSAVFQEPMTSLNPVLTVGAQIAEALVAHNRMSSRDVVRRTCELLDLVGIPAPDKRLADYPHQFSGGMRQRLMIAIAISNNPALLVADEPTTALDVTIQAEILQLLRELQGELGMSMILISHDLGVVAGIADRVAVMYAGRVVEQGPISEIFRSAHHPYTQGLIGAAPRVDREVARLASIPGAPPTVTNRPKGCAFRSRCAWARAGCEELPHLAAIDSDHQSACWVPLADRVTGGIEEPKGTIAHGPADDAGRSSRRGHEGALLDLEKVVVEYVASSRRGVRHVRAVDGVSLRVDAGETIALVGESGSGKSSLARAIVQLAPVTAGRIMLGDGDLLAMRGGRLRKARQTIQIVFQDPFSSLNPKHSVERILAEPLAVHRIGDRAGRRQKAIRALEAVGMGEAALSRYPREFSGGQRQRIGIARALLPDPSLIILDEPVASLDVSIQAQVLNLLLEIQNELGVAYLFISHDLSVVRQVADRVAVMYAGQIVEQGPTRQLFRNPMHPYTKGLLSAIPVPDPAIESSREPLIMSGDMPDPADVHSDRCRLASRCPFVEERCRTQAPPLRDLGAGQFAACHFAEELRHVVPLPRI